MRIYWFLIWISSLNRSIGEKRKKKKGLANVKNARPLLFKKSAEYYTRKGLNNRSKIFTLKAASDLNKKYLTFINNLRQLKVQE